MVESGRFSDEEHVAVIRLINVSLVSATSIGGALEHWRLFDNAVCSILSAKDSYSKELVSKAEKLIEIIDVLCEAPFKFWINILQCVLWLFRVFFVAISAASTIYAAALVQAQVSRPDVKYAEFLVLCSLFVGGGLDYSMRKLISKLEERYSASAIITYLGDASALCNSHTRQEMALTREIKDAIFYNNLTSWALVGDSVVFNVWFGMKYPEVFKIITMQRQDRLKNLLMSFICQPDVEKICLAFLQEKDALRQAETFSQLPEVLQFPYFPEYDFLHPDLQSDREKSAAALAAKKLD